jgi:xylan 1,4-beta-xylosidase
MQNIFLNPILPGCYPDPSICRAKDDYYLVCSSFTYFPGLPVFNSKDLVNWRQIGHVIDRPSQLNLDNLQLSCGLYAPAIHYNNGTFYITNTYVVEDSRERNYIVTAKNPEGPWSDPNWIDNAPGIDPSLFFDEDGKVYWISNGDPPSSRYEGHKVIWMQEIDIENMKLVPGTKIILVNGGSFPEKNPIWIEAPHIFREKDYYYLISAEGGTAEDHSEVVFRSKNVTGPYENYKNNPILTQRHLDPGRKNPVTCAGHADFVRTQSGEWWAVFLACRPYEIIGKEDYYNTGRETFMAPVKWKDGWPVINPDFSEIQYSYSSPDIPEQKWNDNVKNGNFTLRDNFNKGRLDYCWNFLRIPREKWYSLDEQKLRINLVPDEMTQNVNAGFIGRRQQHLHFEAAASMTFTPGNENETAGITAYQNESHFYYMGITLSGSRKIIRLEKGIKQESDKGPACIEIITEEILSAEINTVYFKIKGSGKTINFFYSEDNNTWHEVGKSLSAKYLSTREAGGFVGVYIGLYASSRGQPGSNYAEFNWFEYKGKDSLYSK